MFVDNLTPSELKKLKNKQRKQQKKAALAAAEAHAEQQRRDMNKQKSAGDEEQTPKDDDLIPEKLALVSFISFITNFKLQKENFRLDWLRVVL